MYPAKSVPGFFKIIVIIIVSFQLVSCHCGEVNCPGLEAKYLAFMSSHKGDNIKFINNAGNTVSFDIIRSDSTAPHTNPCGPDGLGGCKCVDCKYTDASSYGSTTDSSWSLIDSLGHVIHTFNGLSLSINFGYTDSIFYSGAAIYKILDHIGAIPIDQGAALYGNDSLVTSVTLGTRTFDSVYIHHTDTTVPPAHHYPHTQDKYFVITSYFTKKYGIVGFYDLRTQSLFYRP